QNTAFQGFFNALLNWFDVLPRNRSTDDGVLKNKTSTDSARLGGNTHMPILAVPTGLADIFAFGSRLLPNGFLVGHLRLSNVGAHIEFAHHAVHDDFQMKLSHPGNDCLSS